MPILLIDPSVFFDAEDMQDRHIIELLKAK
ncbi:hypothetical protein EDF67_1011080 [Sphingobacterium sp. JUb78]|nr:hypothetical protein [Sphingobacterium kitahiroshimense]TCR14973.1 hypothetical protein EDF67_1011080 [Sphingobacterium sp. JUb78]